DDATPDDDTGDDDDTTPTDDDTGDDDTSVPDAEWTFIVYMAGDNSLYSYALDDLNEMKAVGTSADVNILVVFDGTFNNDSRIYKVTQNNLQVLNNPGELNMGDPNTVKTYVTALINNFPAQRTALIYWNHGSGWHEDGEPAVPYKDVCQDGSDWLTNTELDGAMQYVRSNTSVGKFEIVGFDACLMQMIEIAYYLKDDANYMIGSEETEGAQGWDYSASLQYLVNNPTMTTIAFGTKIVDSYLASPDATLSVLKMDQLSNLATKVDALADLLNNVGGASNSDVLNALRDTLYFSDYDYIDLYHFASNIKSKNISTAINTAADNLMSAVNSAVAYADYGQWGYGDAHGVSIYFPDPYWSSYDSAYGNLSFAQDTNWDDVID
nr:clostripain-related cysteine peptidase [bacterium]